MSFISPAGIWQQIRIALLLSCCCISAVAATYPDHQTLRIMAENDITGAYTEVKRLRTALTDTAITTEQVQLINLQARIEFFLGLADQAEKHSQQALELAEQIGDRTGQAEAWLNMTRIALNQGRIEQSIEFTFHSYNLLEEDTEHPELLGEVMFWLTLAYRRLGRVQESMNVALRAQEMAEKNQNLFALAYAYRGLGLSYEQSNRASDAFEYSEKMIEYARKIPSKMIEAYGLQGMATRADSSEDPGLPEQYMHQAIALYRELESPFSLNIGLLSLARMYGNQNRHEERVAVLDEVISIYQEYPNPLGLWYGLTARSEGYQQLSRLDEAERDANTALKIALELDDLRFHSQSLTRLATIAAENKDYATAYELTVEATTLANQAKEQAERSYIVELAEQYEEQSREQQIEQLNEHNALQTMALRQKALKQRWLSTILTGSLLLLSGSLFFLLRLRKTNTLLRGLAARLENIREEERKRIARDMHDEMGQYLTTLRLELSGLGMLCQEKEPQIVERSEILKALVDKTIQVMRNIAASLRPAPLDMGGMASLEWLAEEFTRRTGTACLLDISNVSVSLNDKYMTTIFRIVQESLTNITRHADASKVEIHMATSGRELTLQIHDNGKGFRTGDNKRDSFGLTGMRERAIMLGGQLDIQSEQHKGTRVSFHVQLPKGDDTNG